MKQRKKQREEAGGGAKRGRPSKGSGTEAAAPAQDLLASAHEDVALAAAGEHQPLEAMEVDVAAAVDAPATAQEQTPAAPAARAKQAAVQAADGTAADAEAAAMPAQPAAAPTEQAAAVAPEGPFPAPAALGAAGDAAASPAAAAAPVAPAKTPATAPTPRQSLSGDEAARLAAELEEEAHALRAGGLAAPLLVLPSEAPETREPFSDARLAAFVAAQRAPLSAVVTALAPLFTAPDSGAPLEEAVLRRWAPSAGP